MNGEDIVEDAVEVEVIRFAGSLCISANGQFDNPRIGVAVNSGGDVFVADSGNNRVQKFSSTGSFIRSWGSQGTANGQFNGPSGIGNKS